jgi:protein TonB
MILVQRHSHPAGLPQVLAQMQPARILGLAGAITINAIALMLLLVPVSAPAPIAEEPETIYTIDFRKVEPPPPPKPIEVPVMRPQPQTRAPVPVTQPQPVPQPVNQDVIVPDGNEYVPPTETTTDPLPPAIPGPDPLPSTRLEYAFAPAPTYPREALLDGIEGTVVLRVLVGVDGKPLSVEIERSSGHRRLDDAARRQVLRKWSFKPAIRNGQPVQVYGLVPVNFSISRQ